MSVVLALKIALVPSLIGGITLAGRRWGPSVAGWLSAFPVISAPILFFITLEQGAAFAARASVATLSAVLAILIFGVSYAWAALRCSWFVSAIVGFSCYFIAVALLNAWAPSLLAAGATVLLALVAAPKIYPAPPVSSAVVSASESPYAIWWRMIAGAVLVVLVTHFSSRLGARLSGLFAMFPIIGSVLTVFAHAHAGAGFAIKQLRAMVLGYYAFACFCFLLALLLPHQSVALSFLVALAVAIVVQGASRLYVTHALQVDDRA